MDKLSQNVSSSEIRESPRNGTPSTTPGVLSRRDSMHKDFLEIPKKPLLFNRETNIVQIVLGKDDDKVFGQPVGKPVDESSTDISKIGYRILSNRAVYAGNFSEGKPHTASLAGNIARMLPSFLGGEALGNLIDLGANILPRRESSRIFYPDGCKASVRFEHGVPKRGFIRDPKSKNSWSGEIDENGMPFGEGSFTYEDSQKNIVHFKTLIKSKIEGMWPAEALEAMRSELIKSS